MRIRPSYSLSCIASLLLTVPVMGQTSSAPANSGLPAAPDPVVASHPAKNVQPANGSTQVAMSTEELRERILLDRIEQLERRLSDLETAKAAPADGSPQAADPNAPAQAPAAATPPAAAPADAAPSTPTWSAGTIDFSGLVDVYYGTNFNHPASMTNGLYNFNTRADQFSLNMAKLSLAHSPDPVGFQVDFGFGRAFDMIAGAGETAPSIFRNIEQAYVSLKPPKAHGFEIDFGKFVTSDGAEVIETHNNWNYSRSLLFAWAIPYYHFGVRTSFPIGKSFTAGVMLVNGWNNVEDNNKGKTVMFTGALTKKKFTWFGNFHTGPENAGTNKGWTHLFDTTLLLTPSSKFNAYVNFDWGHAMRPEINASEATVWTTGKWYGVAGALHFMPTSKWSFTPRLEWFKDKNGFAITANPFLDSLLPQDVKEFTLTGEYKMMEGLLSRVEYRHDWSNQFFFEDNLGNISKKKQDTLTLGIVAFFGPKR